MQTYTVDLNFRKAPAMGWRVAATSPAAAVEQAKQFARECGWTERVTKVSVREVKP